MEYNKDYNIFVDKEYLERQFKIYNQFILQAIADTERGAVIEDSLPKTKGYVVTTTANGKIESSGVKIGTDSGNIPTLNSSATSTTESDRIAAFTTSGKLEPLAYTVENIASIVTELPKKMNKSNPTGTGEFSMNGCTASGNNSFAVGSGCTASGQFSAAFINQAKATGVQSFAAGENVTASGDRSTAFGSRNVAGAKTSFVANEGNTISESAHAGFAEGLENSITAGGSGHVEGNNNTVKFNSQHVQGFFAYNPDINSSPGGTMTSDDTILIDIVGGGKPSEPKNLEATSYTGNKFVRGDIYIHSECNGAASGGSYSSGYKVPGAVVLTQSQYNALSTKEANVLYLIKE